MRPRSRPGTTVRHALWLGGLLVVLGGLFGMHGLDNHGGSAAAGIGAVSHTGMTVVADATHAAGRRAEAAAGLARVDAVAVVSALTGTGGRSGMDMGAAGMCMAVLMLGLLAMLLRLHASRGVPLLWLVARPVRAPQAHGRDPDPPSLFSLSIQRC